jgi:S-adenosylmethionine hydrolase
VITLTTDLGEGSPDAGALEGMIWRDAPAARIVTLTHAIPRGDLLAARVMLEQAGPSFPDGTIHLAAVTAPGETPARPLIARAGSALFTGPDNGLVTPLLERAEAQQWETEVYEARLAPPGQTRARQYGLYALLAARLAAGAPPGLLGERTSSPVRASLPAPEMIPGGWRGEVIWVDGHGNLASSLRRAHLEGMTRVIVTVGGVPVAEWLQPEDSAAPGQPSAYFDPFNRLGVTLPGGSAAERLGARAGDVFEARSAR